VNGLNTWDDETTIECEVINYSIEGYDVFPYQIDIKVMIEPKQDSEKVSAEMKAEMMVNGVDLEDLIFPLLLEEISSEAN